MNELVMDIINNVTVFISYFAPGYIFLSCYCYASCLEREEQTDYLIIKCISISYVILIVSQIIGKSLKWPDLGVQGCSFALAMLSGLIIGRVHRSTIANKISQILLNRELSNSFFVDLWERANIQNAVVYVVLTLKDNKGIFEGQISRIISYSKNPALQIAYYKMLSTDNDLICDCSNVDTAEIILYYSDIEKFEYEIIPRKDTEK